MSALSAADALQRALRATETGYVLGMGLMACEYCREPTRCRTAAVGLPVCVSCFSLLKEARGHVCTWVRPKGARTSTKRSDEQKVYLRGGPANGEHWRRADEIGTGKEKKLIGWPVPFLHNRWGCLYVYDPLEDVYQHYDPSPPTARRLGRHRPQKKTTTGADR